MTLELYDRKNNIVLGVLIADSMTDEKVRDWLLEKGLTVLGGKLMDMRTLPFSEADLELRENGAATEPFRQSLLDKLAAQLGEYRAGREGARDLVSTIASGLQETMVRGAINECRESGVSEDAILAILGEDAHLAKGGTRVEMVFTRK